MGRRAAILLVLLGCLGAGCAEDERPPAPKPPEPPGTRGAEGCAGLAERLEREGPDEALHREASRCFQEALERDDLPAARAAWLVLGRGFEGTLWLEADRLGAAAVHGALIDAALARARRLAEGTTPDAEAAAAAWEVAREATEEAEAPPAPALEGTGAWVRARTLADLGLALAEHEGPRVVALADDFALGEPYLLSVLKRWVRQGEEGGLRVGLVAILDGTTRQGIRREPASPLEESAAVAAALEGTGVGLEPTPLDAEEALERLGLEAGEAAVVITDREGRVLGRLSGRNLDPRPLDPVVERAVGR